MSTVPVSNDGISLNLKELKDLMGLEFLLKPSNLSLELVHDPSPRFLVKFICKILFRTVTIKKNKDEENKDANNIDDEKVFDENHLIHFPRIRLLNDCPPDEEKCGPFNFKKKRLTKDYEGDADKEFEEKMSRLLQKAVHPKDGTDVIKERGLKVEAFQVSRLYFFEVPFSTMYFRSRAFPSDSHDINFQFVFEPYFLYQSKETPTRFELKVDNVKSKNLANKKDFYPLLSVGQKGWNEDSHHNVQEFIQEFDIREQSMKFINCNPLSITNRNVSAEIHFTLVREVTRPSMTLLLPIYVIALLIPLVAFFHSIEGVSFFDNAEYLVTLLLTLVAHRQVFSEGQVSVLVLTSADKDFLLCLFFILFQMMLFMILHLIDVENDVWIITVVEEVIIILYICCRVLNIRSAMKLRGRKFDFDNISSQTEAITVPNYLELRGLRKILSAELNYNVEQKTYFATNLKILMHERRHQNENDNAIRRFPTCDIFRFQVDKKDGAKCMKDFDQNTKSRYLYHKPLGCKELGNPPQGDEVKVIYTYTVANSKVPIELQIQPKGRVTGEMHQEYKKIVIKKWLETQKEEGKHEPVSKKTLNRWLLDSIFIELRTVFSYSGTYNRLRGDQKLYKLLRELLDEYKENTTENTEKDYEKMMLDWMKEKV